MSRFNCITKNGVLVKIPAKSISSWSWVKKNMKAKMWELLRADRHMYLCYKDGHSSKNNRVSLIQQTGRINYCNYFDDEDGYRTHEYYARQLKDIWNFDWRECTGKTSYEVKDIHMIRRRNQKHKWVYTKSREEVKKEYEKQTKSEAINLWSLVGGYSQQEKSNDTSGLINEAVSFFDEVLFNYEIPEFNLSVQGGDKEHTKGYRNKRVVNMERHQERLDDQ